MISLTKTVYCRPFENLETVVWHLLSKWRETPKQRHAVFYVVNVTWTLETNNLYNVWSYTTKETTPTGCAHVISFDKWKPINENICMVIMLVMTSVKLCVCVCFFLSQGMSLWFLKIHCQVFTRSSRRVLFRNECAMLFVYRNSSSLILGLLNLGLGTLASLALIPWRTLTNEATVWFFHRNTSASILTRIFMRLTIFKFFRTSEASPSWLAIACPGIRAGTMLTSRVRNTLSAIFSSPTDSASTLLRSTTPSMIEVTAWRTKSWHTKSKRECFEKLYFLRKSSVQTRLDSEEKRLHEKIQMYFLFFRSSLRTDHMHVSS